MISRKDVAAKNRTDSRRRWGRLSSSVLKALDEISRVHKLSVLSGELIYLNNNWYVTHSGLLRVAQKKGCVGIHVRPAPEFSDPAHSRWAFEAVVYKSASCRGFTGFGDADPSNVSTLVRGAEMRVAETRAVNRALRKAYGIGICSAEEIGTVPPSPEPAAAARKAPLTAYASDHPLRDRLLVLVRQHRLDVRLVKLYAAEFCGVEEVRDANRERMREFIERLSQEATTNCEALQQKLATYEKRTEGIA